MAFADASILIAPLLALPDALAAVSLARAVALTIGARAVLGRVAAIAAWFPETMRRHDV